VRACVCGHTVGRRRDNARTVNPRRNHDSRSRAIITRRPSSYASRPTAVTHTSVRRLIAVPPTAPLVTPFRSQPRTRPRTGCSLRGAASRSRIVSPSLRDERCTRRQPPLLRTVPVIIDDSCAVRRRTHPVLDGQEDVRPAVQTVADRRLGRGQDVHTVPVLGRRVHHDVHLDDRYGPRK